jgi:hypothetical protein
LAILAGGGAPFMRAALILLLAWSARGRLDRVAGYSPSKSISEHGFGGNAIADWVVMVQVASSSAMAAKILVVIRIGSLLHCAEHQYVHDAISVAAAL